MIVVISWGGNNDLMEMCYVNAMMIIFIIIIITQQKSYSISHLLGTLTTWWLVSHTVVTVAYCRQHSNWAANGNVATLLSAVINGDYTVTIWLHCDYPVTV